MAPLPAVMLSRFLLLLALTALSSLKPTLGVRLSSNICATNNYEYKISLLPASGWYYRGSGNDDFCNANPLLKQYLCNVAASPYCTDETIAQTCATATNPSACNAASRVFSVIIDSDCDFVVFCEYRSSLTTVATPSPPAPVTPVPPTPVTTPSPPSPVTSNPPTSPSGVTTPPSPPAPTSPSPNVTNGSSGGSSIGIIVGCVVGAIVVIAAVISIALCCFFKSRRQQKGAGSNLPTHHDAYKDAAAPYYPAAPTKLPGYANPQAGALPPTSGESGLSFATPAGDGTSKVYPYEELLHSTNGFSVSNLLGQGGFSKVYRGMQADGTAIAVKVLQSDPVNGPNNESFYSEMAIMSRLRHKYLVSMLGYAAAGTERIIVLEFCKGGTLFQALHGPDRLDWNKRLRTALYVTIGLEYLHDGVEPPILHRDIKSANVLFADENRLAAKLSDFGVARFEDGPGAVSARTRVLGTRGYVALEYLQSGQVSKYTDIYSLGVLLSELVTGRPCTFQMGNDQVALRDWVVENRNQPLTLMDPALGGNFHPQQAIGLIQLAVECMNQNEPKARPLAAQVHQRIEQLIGITAGSPPSAEQVFVPPSGGLENNYRPAVVTNSLTGSEGSYGAPSISGGSSIVGDAMNGFRSGGPEPPKNMTMLQNFTNIQTGR
ncbi:Putative serine/threonine protein kinase [Klebsormidium nitens]|uniref:Putative serine/threonine protein kinase n=1 Tax=Klebsormidium nitens TaxID=105231 RepID=A0A1Y1IBB5_KLENI|nr:Putative serine/threonine protein kinase [Klebsormidium nitens]|eukprot:GAQ88210.1 Putative serine/threonine protein kinase [Klebsormidium nitens]